MPKKQKVLTISLQCVPILVENPYNANEDWYLESAIEVTPDPAFMNDQKHFTHIEWIALNHPDDELKWTIKKKNNHLIAEIGPSDNSTDSKGGLVPFLSKRSYTVQVEGKNRWGFIVDVTKDPEIHWGRRG